MLVPDAILDLFYVDPTSPSGLRWAVEVGQGHSLRRVGSVAGSLRPTGYYQVTYQRKCYGVHRIIAQKCKVSGYEHLANADEYEVDHIIPISKGGRNIPSNLRVVTCRENSRNRSTPHKHMIGAYPRGSRWRAGCCSKGKMHWIGTFDTELEAHLAYLRYTL